MKTKPLLKDTLLITLSAITLTVIHAPFDMGFFSPFAYIPLIIGFYKTQNKKRFFLTTYIVWTGYWLFNLFWLINIIALGWVAIGLVMALFKLIFLFSLNICQKRKHQLWLCLPLIITGIEWLYGLPFGGFQWHLLGHSMYKYLAVIQIADIFGVAAITAVLAMINGLICDLLLYKNTRKQFVPICVCTAVVISVLSYGAYRLNTIPKELTKGPLIGSIQTNVPSIIKEDKFEGKNILSTLFKLSDQAIESGAELLVWPETIVAAAINKDFLVYSQEDSESWWYHNKLSVFTKSRTHLIAGATALGVGEVDGQLKVVDQYNTALMYLPDGSQWHKRYDKIHLVPFGEYIPPQDVEWLKKIFLSFSPYDYDYTLTAGSEPVRFEANLEEKNWSFAVMICYEDTDAQLNRKLVYSPEKGKADWLLNISNDGWYVWYEDGKITPSIELAQRTAISVFRAVENRISIIRSVNTGISCKIDPLGRIVDGYEKGSLPEKAFDRQAVEGFFIDRPCIYPKLSVFTKTGEMLSNLSGIGLICIIAVNLKKSRRA